MPRQAFIAPARMDSRDERWQVAALCFVLAVITFAVFGQTLTHEFVNLDDGAYVYDNPMVAGGLTFKDIVWAFTHFHAFNWHPLTWLSHELDCQLYGLNPGDHHLTNVLLHTATVIALFLVLRQMTGALWRSAFVAAVFAIHPLRAESVAWVAERKDVLSGLFFMLTIGAYVHYARQPWSAARYGLVLVLFTLGLMSKPMLVTLPLVLLLLDYWPLQRVEPRKLLGLVLEKLPLFALSAAACVVTLLAQNGAIQSTKSYPLSLRLGNALVNCMVYLGQMVWPTGLAALYPYPHNGMQLWEVGLAGMLLAGLSAFAFWQRRTQPWLLIGWLWYLVMLLPVIGIIQVGVQIHADRYTYLPQIGIGVALTWLVAEWGVKLQTGRAVFGGIMTATLAVLMVCAWKQTSYWKNSETLWNRTLACTTDNDTAHFNLGVALGQKGKEAEAVAQYQKALAINPNYADAHVNLGFIFLQRNSLDQAITQFQKALLIKPDHADAHDDLGIALFRMGRVDEAMAHYQKALQFAPDNPSVHNNLGTVLLKIGRVDEAIAHYQKALDVKANFADAHYGLGNALYQNGKMAEAIAQYQKALQIDPADLKIQNNLAWLLATCPDASLRNGNKAVQLARQANELAGGNPIPLHTLAAAFAEVGQFNDAISNVQKAIELARTSGRQDLLEEFNDELKHYETGLPLASVTGMGHAAKK